MRIEWMRFSNVKRTGAVHIQGARSSYGTLFARQMMGARQMLVVGVIVQRVATAVNVKNIRFLSEILGCRRCRRRRMRWGGRQYDGTVQMCGIVSYSRLRWYVSRRIVFNRQGHSPVQGPQFWCFLFQYLCFDFGTKVRSHNHNAVPLFTRLHTLQVSLDWKTYLDIEFSFSLF